MKTTVELPDDIFRKAKILAAERRITLKDLLIEALQRFIASPAPSGEKARKAELKRLLKAMQATNTEPMVPMTREELYADR